MTTHAYTEDQLVEQPAITLFAELGWQTVLAMEEVFGDPSNAAKHEADQRAVISGWLGLLGRQSAKAIQIPDAGDVVYQLVHRAASACSMPKPPKLLYLHFEPSPAKYSPTTAQYRKDLKYLHELMGSPKTFPFYLAEVPLHFTEAFQRIKSLPKRRQSTDVRVRDAIRSSRLFDFGEPRIERI